MYKWDISRILSGNFCVTRRTLYHSKVVHPHCFIDASEKYSDQRTTMPGKGLSKFVHFTGLP